MRATSVAFVDNRHARAIIGSVQSPTRPAIERALILPCVANAKVPRPVR